MYFEEFIYSQRKRYLNEILMVFLGGHQCLTYLGDGFFREEFYSADFTCLRAVCSLMKHATATNYLL
jgi:hypothetical protein